jgi:hypothetical protein
MASTTNLTPAVIVVEQLVRAPGDEWRAALEHVTSRFARVAPLDAEAVLDAGDFPAQVAYLVAWAEPLDVDLDRELGRWYDENLAMFVRPDSRVTRSIRALAAERPVHAVSVLPPRAAESLLRHAGAWRSIAELHASTDDATAITASLTGELITKL